jgi:glutamyl-tRNA synthetase
MIRTRFAPSPTGTLHIGSAHTALFNWLFARHHGGQFLIRIEDTDRERSKAEHVSAILDGLGWLGIYPDEPPVFQLTRQARHAEVAMELLASGHAYRCWCSPEELVAMREKARAEGRPPRYDGMWRDRDPAGAPKGVAPAIRLRAPREGSTVVDDLVQGRVEVANTELDDMIILRSDGTPTYLHAVVVDDHDMEITHVIRGDDHLTNTFRQAQVYDLMGWSRPAFAHVPLIHGADGAKLSKRHGATSVFEFREQGYLPEALLNYLVRLGWGHGDAEILSVEEMIALFDVDGVGRAASRMDYAKLGHVNGVWLRRAEDERLVSEVRARMPQIDGGKLLAIMPALKERAKTLVELAEGARFLVAVAEPMEAKAASLLTSGSRMLLAALADVLVETDFTPGALDAALRSFAEARGVKLGEVAQPLRAALTGRTTSPPIDATMAALGPGEVLARIKAVVG